MASPGPARSAAGAPPPAPPRSTAPAPAVLAWWTELGRTAPWLWRAYGLLPAMPARAREQALVAFAQALGAPRTAQAHEAWQAFLGPHQESAVVREAVAHARRSADGGRPVDAEVLRLSLPPRALRATRATLACAALAAAAELGLADLREQARLAKEPRPASLLVDVVALAAGGPLFGASVAAGALAGSVNRLAPPPAPAEQPTDASLLSHVLAAAAPAYLANALVRLVAVRSPWTIALGVRSGRSAATLRVGRGEVTVTDGLAPDVLAVLDGDVDLLVEAASSTLLGELHEAVGQPEP